MKEKEFVEKQTLPKGQYVCPESETIEMEFEGCLLNTSDNATITKMGEDTSGWE